MPVLVTAPHASSAPVQSPRRASALPASASPQRPATAATHLPRLSVPALESFTRNLEIQLDAGVPLVRALEVQSQHAETPALATLGIALLRQLHAGTSLADAIDQHPKTFHSVYRSLVRAGEHSGRLPLMLRELASFLAWREEIRKTVRRAATYPALVLVATFGLLLLIIGYVLPKFESLFTRLGDDVPAAAAFLLATGKFVSAHMTAILAGAVLTPLVVCLLLRSRTAQRHVLCAATHLPLFGKVLRAVDLARLTRTLAILAQAGIPLVHALELSRDAVADPSLGNKLDGMRGAVVGGQTLSQAALGSGVFPPIALNLITIGEESGQMAAVLERLAHGFDRRAREAVQKALAMLEPAFTLVLGVLVGGLALVVIATLYKTMMAVGR
jgi:type II secretory pathway component PulF